MKGALDTNDVGREQKRRVRDDGGPDGRHIRHNDDRHWPADKSADDGRVVIDRFLKAHHAADDDATKAVNVQAQLLGVLERLVNNAPSGEASKSVVALLCSLATETLLSNWLPRDEWIPCFDSV